MHFTIEELLENDEVNDKILALTQQAGRNSTM